MMEWVEKIVPMVQDLRLNSFALSTLTDESESQVRLFAEEVVPAVRQHSTKALRVAAEKMKQLADYLDQAQAQRK